MNTKHTPGPWKIINFVGHEATGNKDRAFMGTIEAHGICDIYAGPFSFSALKGRTNKEAEANAKLIAASPELLEALNYAVFDLKELHSFLTDQAESFEGDEKRMLMENAAAVYERIMKAKSAIEKATK